MGARAAALKRLDEAVATVTRAETTYRSSPTEENRKVWETVFPVKEKAADDYRRAEIAASAALASLTTGSILAFLPPSVASAKTDADGRFRLKVQRGKRLMLFAQASRSTFGGNSENYLWLVPLDAADASGRIMLSNDNLYNPAGL